MTKNMVKKQTIRIKNETIFQEPHSILSGSYFKKVFKSRGVSFHRYL